MNLLTIISLGLLAIVFAFIYRARIRKSKNQDPDFARRDAVVKDPSEFDAKE
jgi:uncharacterized membrane protein